jgi:hypothetical protein
MIPGEEYKAIPILRAMLFWRPESFTSFSAAPFSTFTNGGWYESFQPIPSGGRNRLSAAVRAS